ncbi:MAG: hypothetical protein ABGY71_11010 [bacterium]|nr:hypothetical protein [Planctomycetota bacterium]HIL53293.1 hypothetical protein [Planctomycetota bacterium]
MLLFCAAPSAAQSGEPRLAVQLLDNGNFAESLSSEAEGRVPWWRVDLGSDQVRREEGVFWLGTQGAYGARQPVAAYAPLAAGLCISGRLRGPGELRLHEGGGHTAILRFQGGDEADGRRFEFTLEELASAPEALYARGFELSGDLQAFAAPQPRFVLEIASASEEEPAFWTDLECLVPLPCPDEAALRVEVIEILDEIFTLWREHVIDPETGFASCVHDVYTAGRLFTRDGLLGPVHSLLLEAVTVHNEPAWRALLDRFLESWFARCFHPQTSLPRNWDTEQGTARDQRPVELHQTLEFLSDLADHGPELWRAEAARRLRLIGERVLQAGALPDGQVAPAYTPASGAPSVGFSQLRRFDVPAPLAVLGALDGDARYRDLAREAVSEFEYTWLWPGTWESIDPGFDDDFGHYAERALVMSRAWPLEDSFRRIVRGGYDFYAPLWRDALRFGGNIAADQIRAWRIFRGLAELEPELLGEVERLLRSAARVHFKGEQYGNGAWGDVTVFDFDPRAGLQVGDLPGMPQNLLQGLASNYSTGFALRDGETRAMFCAVMRSSRENYRAPHGYLVTRGPRQGANPAGGSLRFAAPLVDMLVQLSPAAKK